MDYFKNEEYIIWGKQLSQKAEKVTGLEIQHKKKVVQIIAEMTKKFDLSDTIADNLTKVRIESYTLGPYMQSPEEFNAYWLEYITKDPYSFQKTTWEDSIRRMIEDSMIYRSRSAESILRKFNERHFSKNDKFKLYGAMSKINIIVPYSLNYFDIKYAIEVIEKLTDVEVTNIYLSYWTHEIDIPEFFVRVQMSEYYRSEKDWNEVGIPFISKKKFLTISFDKIVNGIPFSIENWFREIPEFKEYITEKDINTYTCWNCNTGIYDKSKGQDNILRCSFCGEYSEKPAPEPEDDGLPF